ncbi:SDR family oxidoreductase [Chloroflexota bacterium]
MQIIGKRKDMTEERIAVVTGANRGIGLEICRQLAANGIRVVLTARNIKKGSDAAESLNSEGADIRYCYLDVTDEESVQRAADYVMKSYGKLDILVNNAGVGVDRDNTCLDINIDRVKENLETNTFGAMRVCKAFIPIMLKSEYGRIVNISSGMGALSNMNSGSSGYRISKAALNVVTAMLACELKDTNILVNSMAPGWVKTDMGGPDAVRSVEEGADTAVWLATNTSLPTGRFFQDRKEIPW